MGRVVAALGAALVVLGGMLWLGGRLGLGALPGDLRLSGQGWSCFFPITLSILLSLLLTLVLNLILRSMSK